VAAMHSLEVANWKNTMKIEFDLLMKNYI
jgi:hypothetical protein